jgi:hypothetical protein
MSVYLYVFVSLLPIASWSISKRLQVNVLESRQLAVVESGSHQFRPEVALTSFLARAVNVFTFAQS